MLTMQRQAVTYRRVSTGRQAIDGESLEAQAIALERYCQGNALTLTHAFEDAGKSGRSRAKRPGLESALRAVGEAKGVLVVYSLSRLARSIRDASSILSELRAMKADLAIVDMKLDTSNIYGELVFNMMASLAQFESQLIGQRTQVAHSHLKKKHGHNPIGQPSYGYARGKGSRERVENAAEQAVIALARQLRQPTTLCGGPTSFDVIAEQLNALGHRTRKGGLWHGYSVQRILRKAPPAKSAPHGKSARVRT